MQAWCCCRINRFPLTTMSGWTIGDSYPFKATMVFTTCRTNISEKSCAWRIPLAAWAARVSPHARPKTAVGALTNHRCHFTYCWTHYEHYGRRLTQQQIVFTRTISRTLLLLGSATDFSGFSRQGNNWPQSQIRKFWLGTLLWTKCIHRSIKWRCLLDSKRARTTFFVDVNLNILFVSLDPFTSFTKKTSCDIWLEGPDVMWYLRCESPLSYTIRSKEGLLRGQSGSVSWTHLVVHPRHHNKNSELTTCDLHVSAQPAARSLLSTGG